MSTQQSQANQEHTVQELVELLNLETIEHNLFRGQNCDIGGRSVFGGQVIGQALIAALRTLDENRLTHSLHAYFLRPGDMRAPIVYEVARIRDGGSFTTRSVIAIQHGEAIFSMSASFHRAEKGLEHQLSQMPDVPPPENLESEHQIRCRMANRIDERVRALFLQLRPIEIRPIDPVDLFNPEPRDPIKQLWFRVPQTLGDNRGLHHAILAYASDFALLGTGMLPHGLSFVDPNVHAASIDHAIWFHQPFRVDEWLLYAMESPCAGQARSYNRAQIFTRDGRLVASVCQEGLMRARRRI
ncbi:Acyl-CoA thiolesterase II [gamma proteobacterium HdN1]|nr:Acyl-CoA thiolesterase II [gamma proteobacterium HdN1]